MEKKRKLFIELSPGKVQEILEYIRTHAQYTHISFMSPFEVAINLAVKNKWEIVSLDAAWLNKIIMKIKETGKAELIGYANHNHRERMWARKVRKLAKPNDFVVMHPNHVEGFMKDAGYSGKRATFLSNPIFHPYPRLEGVRAELVAKQFRKYLPTRIVKKNSKTPWLGSTYKKTQALKKQKRLFCI